MPASICIFVNRFEDTMSLKGFTSDGAEDGLLSEASSDEMN